MAYSVVVLDPMRALGIPRSLGGIVTATPIVFGNTAPGLRPAPINAAWIIAGDPVARNASLSRSHDLMARTLVWDCTPGVFMWHYDVDETIHVLEGSIVLDDGVTPARRLGPGDVVFFPAGAVVRWTVETHVRKLAFFRRQLPKPIASMARGVHRLRSLMRSWHRVDGETSDADGTTVPSAAVACGVEVRRG